MIKIYNNEAQLLTYSITEYLNQESLFNQPTTISQKSDSTGSMGYFNIMPGNSPIKFVFIPQSGISDDSRKIIESQVRQYADVWIALSNT
jgi:hypothetical protein